jgi:hypothetical protein
METTTHWPINQYGTSWRRGVMYFDWLDEQVVSQAIDMIDPCKITIRCHAVAAIGFDSVGDMVTYRLAEPLPYGKNWDKDRLCIIIDPCSDPEALRTVVEESMDTVRFSVFGVALLDLADETIYRQLSAALEECHGQYVGEYPIIEF